MTCLFGYSDNFNGDWMTSNIDFLAFVSFFATVSAFILKDFRHVLDLYILGQIINYGVFVLGWLWIFIAFGAAYYLMDKSFNGGLINLVESNNQFTIYLLYHSFTGYLLVNAARGKN